MSLKRTAFLSVLIFSSVIFTFTFISPEPEIQWQKEVLLSDSSGRFTDIEVHGNSLHAVSSDPEQGLHYFSSSIDFSVADHLQRALFGNNWNHEWVTQDEGAGSYASLQVVQGRPYVSYQDSTVGESAVYSAYRDSTGWNPVEIDSVQNNGPNVGMYNALTEHRGRPFMVYHASSGRRLIAAYPENGRWVREELDTDKGWFNDLASCDSAVIAGFTDTETGEVHTGKYMADWSVDNLNLSTDSDLAVDHLNCEPLLVYQNDNQQSIEFVRNGERTKIDDTRFARVSLDATQQGFHVSYRDYGEGLGYAYSPDGVNWSTELVDNSTDAGVYNDIEVAENGDVHVLYRNDSALIHAQYLKGSAGELQTYYRTSQTVFGTIAVISILSGIVIRREELLKLLNSLKASLANN
jgi:hypothetical protein